MAQLKELIVNGASRLLNTLDVDGSATFKGIITGNVNGNLTGNVNGNISIDSTTIDNDYKYYLNFIRYNSSLANGIYKLRANEDIYVDYANNDIRLNIPRVKLTNLVVGTGGTTGNIFIYNANSVNSGSYYYGKINSGTLTANRTYTLPNKAGTIALTTDIPTIPTLQQLIGNTSIGNATTSIYWNGSNFAPTNVAIATATGTTKYLAYYKDATTIEPTSCAHLNYSNGTNNKNGYEEFVIGNSIDKTVENSKFGRLTIYSRGTKGNYIVAAEQSSQWYTITLPAADGTVALAENTLGIYYTTLDFTKTNEKPGVYSLNRNNSTNEKNPVTGQVEYGSILNFAGGQSNQTYYAAQLIISSASGADKPVHAYIRRQASGTSSPSWSNWSTLLDNNNYTNYTIDKNIFSDTLKENRLMWITNTGKIYAGNHYTDATSVVINSISKPTENFYVNGTSKFNGQTIFENSTRVNADLTTNSLIVNGNTTLNNDVIIAGALQAGTSINVGSLTASDTVRNKVTGKAGILWMYSNKAGTWRGLFTKKNEEDAGKDIITIDINNNAIFYGKAEALNVSSNGVGSNTKPVYFDTNGKPQPITYDINKTVPSNAVFTDTKVTQSNSSTQKWRKVLLHYKEDDAYNSAVTASTAQVFASQKIAIQPYTGNLRTEGSITANEFIGTATKVSNKLKIGTHEFDGSEEVTIPIYNGEIQQ